MKLKTMNYALEMNNRSLDIAVQSYIRRIMAKYVGWWFFHHPPLDGGNLYGTGVSAGVSPFGNLRTPVNRTRW